MRLALVLFAAACTSDPDPSDNNDDDGGPRVTKADSVTGGTGGFSFVWDPVAVGFEFYGMVDGQGNLGNWQTTGNLLPPFMVLTFADKEFFGSGNDELTCSVLALFEPEPLDRSEHFTLEDPGVQMSSAYEVALQVDTATSDCAGRVDPVKWGANAENLLDPFVGARLGVGWAPMTDYLRDAWNEDSLDTAGDAMMATYIALNERDGTWIGRDWTTAILYEGDFKSEQVTVNDDNSLEFVDVTALDPAQHVPEGFIQSFAYWYQDFPLLDLSNLRDGAPGPSL